MGGTNSTGLAGYKHTPLKAETAEDETLLTNISQEIAHQELHIVIRKCRGCMLSLFFVILFPCCLGLLSMLVYCLMDNRGALHPTTKILVLADSFWKASFFTFIAIGMVTVMSAVLGSEEDNDWVNHFWSTESIPLRVTTVRLNIKSWQATGFILKPLGLYVLGTFLFVTQIVLSEGIKIKSGTAWLELNAAEKDSKKCFFIEQVDWQTAQASGLHESGSHFVHIRNISWVWTPKCGSSRSCNLNEARINFTTAHSVGILPYLHAIWGQYIRRTPPSQCYGAEWIRPWPAFNVPKKDFSLPDVDLTKPDYADFTYAPAYLGGEGPFWNRSYYFTNTVRTACHYECSEWAEETAVTKLLELGMVMGGGMAIVAVSNTIGGYLGNKLVDRDTKVEELAKVILGDVRVSFLALPRLLPWRRPKADQRTQRIYFRSCWWAIIGLFMKLAVGTWIAARLYRPMIVKYSESMADRGLVRCIVYVGLFNTALRSTFCFTKEMWNEGEDSGFHLHKPHEGNKCMHAGVVRKSYDLYNWMRLSASEIIELLFDYTYNLGPTELGSDDLIEVKMRFDTTEDQYHIAAGAQGQIRKTKGFGAVYEGSKVFVHFNGDGIKSNNMATPLGAGPYRIPVELTFLAEVAAGDHDKDDWQSELKDFLGITMKL